MELVIAERSREPKATPYAALGRRIAEARTALRIGGREAAAQIGIPYGTWANFESGVSRPRTLAQLRRIATWLDLDPEELADLGGYTLYRRGESDLIQAPPGYRPVVSRLIGKYTPTELTRLERAIAALFEIRPVSNQPPQDASSDHRSADADERDAHRDDRGA